MLCQVGGIGEIAALHAGRVGGDGRGEEWNVVQGDHFVPFLFEHGREEVWRGESGDDGLWGGASGGRAPRRGGADFGGQLGDLLAQTFVFSFHLGEALEEDSILVFHLQLLAFEFLDLESLPLSRSLSRSPVPENAFYTALFLLIFGLGSFSWRKIRLGGG
ncbi:hypothetical protein ACKS0A_08425 [Histoplasma ohiense]